MAYELPDLPIAAFLGREARLNVLRFADGMTCPIADAANRVVSL